MEDSAGVDMEACRRDGASKPPAPLSVLLSAAPCGAWEDANRERAPDSAERAEMAEVPDLPSRALLPCFSFSFSLFCACALDKH